MLVMTKWLKWSQPQVWLRISSDNINIGLRVVTCPYILFRGLCTIYINELLLHFLKSILIYEVHLNVCFNKFLRTIFYIEQRRISYDPSFINHVKLSNLKDIKIISIFQNPNIKNVLTWKKKKQYGNRDVLMPGLNDTFWKICLNRELYLTLDKSQVVSTFIPWNWLILKQKRFMKLHSDNSSYSKLDLLET